MAVPDEVYENLRLAISPTEAKSAEDAAARWWARTMLDSQIDIGVPESDTEKLSLIRYFENVRAAKTGDEFLDNPQGIIDFVAHLTHSLEQEGEKTLKVDYHPMGLLADAVEVSGIDGSLLPFKSRTDIFL